MLVSTNDRFALRTVVSHVSPRINAARNQAATKPTSKKAKKTASNVLHGPSIRNNLSHHLSLAIGTSRVDWDTSHL